MSKLVQIPLFYDDGGKQECRINPQQITSLYKSQDTTLLRDAIYLGMSDGSTYRLAVASIAEAIEIIFGEGGNT